jgi:hypothetical protein
VGHVAQEFISYFDAPTQFERWIFELLTFDVPRQVLSKDLVSVTVDAVICYHVRDPLAAVINVNNYRRNVQMPLQLQKEMADEAEAAAKIRTLRALTEALES